MNLLQDLFGLHRVYRRRHHVPNQAGAKWVRVAVFQHQPPRLVGARILEQNRAGPWMPSPTERMHRITDVDVRHLGSGNYGGVSSDDEDGEERLEPIYC